MGIYNPNCYSEGYDDGFNDGLSGKSPNYTGSPKFKSLLSQSAVETYIEGYKEGYKNGKQKSHGLYES